MVSWNQIHDFLIPNNAVDAISHYQALLNMVYLALVFVIGGVAIYV